MYEVLKSQNQTTGDVYIYIYIPVMLIPDMRI